MKIKRQNTNGRVLGTSLRLHKCRLEQALLSSSFCRSLGGGRVPPPSRDPKALCNVRLIFQSSCSSFRTPPAAAGSGDRELQRGGCWKAGVEVGTRHAVPRHRVPRTVTARWHESAAVGLHNGRGRGEQSSAAGRQCQEQGGGREHQNKVAS